MKYTIELAVKGNITTREVEADGVLVDNSGFVVFYADTGGDNKKSIISYNPRFIASIKSREND